MPDTCSKHPADIPGWDGTFQELADAIENMRYDKTIEFLDALNLSFYGRYLSDYRAGKTKLAQQLLLTANHLVDAAWKMRAAWDICKPHMKIDNG